MDFVIGLLLLANWKGDSYDSILVIVNRLTKIMYYELVIVTTNAPRPAEVIINMVMRYYSIPNFIINDCKAIFTSKFWFSLRYFLGIKRQLFTVFYS